MKTASGIASALACALFCATAARADELGTTKRVSEANGLDANEASLGASISAGGQLIAFSSRASDLVAGDTNTKADVFVYDVVSRRFELVSFAGSGAQGDEDSGEPVLTPDGRFVAFTSRASNLIANDTNGVADVFVRDRIAGTLERVSLGVGGIEGDLRSQGPRISADGNYIVFTSLATNFVINDLNGQPDVYMWDRALQRCYRMSGGFLAEGTSTNGSISADGRYVAFQSTSLLQAGTDTNGVADIFVRDLIGNSLVRISNANGLAANGASESPAISGDGNTVAFESMATNFVVGDTNNRRDIYVFSAAAGTTTLASVSTSGAQGELASMRPSLSHDGRWLLFESASAAFNANDQNGVTDVFLTDLQTGATRLLSRSSDGVPADAACIAPAMTADASTIVFESAATTLVANDGNALSDIFLHRPFISVTTNFCAGDGTALACPCANFGQPGRGCENSNGTGGARLVASGISSVSVDSLLLRGDGMPPSSPCLYFQGTGTINGGLGAAFGDGLRCLGGTIVRLGIRMNQSGASGYGTALGDMPISARGLVGAAGGVRHYQLWHRDAAPFCAIGLFNLSNAVTATWSP